jgi:hypothetical protein
MSQELETPLLSLLKPLEHLEHWDLSRLNKTCVLSLHLVPISYCSVNHIDGRAKRDALYERSFKTLTPLQ